ncbi:MAG: S9 family peptidase [candidate division WOR-3 bacterium]|nr:MAG: S9 family peptidase [candidate division WOR-3 bacterium]
MKVYLITLIPFVLSLVTSDASVRRQGNLVIDNIPGIPDDLAHRLRGYENARYAHFCDWFHDGGILIRTRFADVAQLHRVDIPGGMRRQLTFSEDATGYGQICPDRKTSFLLFTRDSAGNEKHQIFKYNYHSGAETMLTDGRSKHMAVVWTNSGTSFAFASTMRNGKDFDIYTGTLTGRQSFIRVLQNEGYWYPMDFSPDDRRLLIKQYLSSDESYLYILDLATRVLDQVNPTDQTVSYGQTQWTPDGKGIYYISDQFSEFRQLIYYDIATKQNKVLTEQIPWDITEFDIAPSGAIALLSREEFRSKLYFLDAESGALTSAQMPYGMITDVSFSRDGNLLALRLNTPTSPSDVFALNLKNKAFIRWTYSEIGQIDTTRCGVAELIYYPTFDSAEGSARMIPALYYVPTDAHPPHPVIVFCHGGPASQANPWFSPLLQYYLIEMGIALIRPNIRGSTGMGKTFMNLDDGYLREDAVRDIGTLIDWIQQQPELDASRIAIAGGSYGGYMVLASLIHHGDRLRCGISSSGISNFVTFLENTGAYRQDLRRSEYGDERDPAMREFLTNISPLTNAHNITRPLFVAQGLNDPRVPVSEAEQIVQAVRKNGIDVWYLLAEDEGHGFSKKPNREFLHQAEILFLQRHLLE